MKMRPVQLALAAAALAQQGKKGVFDIGEISGADC